MALTLADTANNEWTRATLKPVRHMTRCRTTTESTYHLEHGDGNILSHNPALFIGPAGDARLQFHTGRRKRSYPSNNDPYQTPAGSLSGYCQHLRGQDQQHKVEKFPRAAPTKKATEGPPIGSRYGLPQFGEGGPCLDLRHIQTLVPP